MLKLGFADTRHPEPADPAGAGQTHDPDEDPSVGEEAGAVVLALLPWGVSILFHAALVLLAFFIIWAVIAENQEEELIIPDVRLSKDPGAPLTMKQMQQVKPSSARRSVTRTTTPTETTSLTTKVNLKTPLIGVQGASGGKSSPFGTTVGAGDGFSANFFGSAGGNAKQIVFVVDASGSLLDTFPFVILELKKTINNLDEKQSFTIIFFQGNEAVEVAVPRAGLKPATSTVKRKVIEWIEPANGNIQPIGGTNPLPGIQKALRYRPQLMYLLSDNITGGGTGATMYEIEQKRLLDEIKRANKAGTKINAIQFLYPDPLKQVAGKGTLEQIAESSGGIYKFVDADELNIR